LLAFACKKETVDTPVNTGENNFDLDCATCPSIFHPFETISEETITTTLCDDFTAAPWPTDGTFLEGEIVGYTQDGTQPVTVLEGGACEFGINEGMYLWQKTSFSFDGSNQVARFHIYGFETQFYAMGYTVNGSTDFYLDDTFPITIGGVVVDIDYSAPPIGSWTAVYLTFVGEINTVEMIGFESGVVELCVTKTTVLTEPPLIDKTHYVYFDDFYDYSGTVIGAYPNQKTPAGYYGMHGATMVIDFSQFLAYAPTRIGFVHASSSESDYLVNVKINDTPLIITVPDSLDYFLKPYGYRAEIYNDPDGLMWINSVNPPITGAYVDSIIITGNNMNKVKLGVELNESELRRVCSYYEK